jgi:hypothetical protein
MKKPVILTVDDDTEVLRAIERDLKKHYEAHYRVLRAESGAPIPRAPLIRWPSSLPRDSSPPSACSS